MWGTDSVARAILGRPSNSVAPIRARENQENVVRRVACPGNVCGAVDVEPGAHRGASNEASQLVAVVRNICAFWRRMRCAWGRGEIREQEARWGR